MIAIKPYKLLLPYGLLVLALGATAVFISGLGLFSKLILMAFLIIYAFYESLKLFQYLPYSLDGLFMPDQNKASWKLVFSNGTEAEARLLNSTRITGKIIILHFRSLHCRIRVCKMILPAMVGEKNFHNLLMYLKTN